MTSNRMTLNVFNPTGIIKNTQIHASRLNTLEGKTICELSNAGWEYNRIFPAVREQLQKMFPTANIIPYTESISTRPEIENLALVDKVLKEKRCDAVISGMAA
jgi:hypothetical protein